MAGTDQPRGSPRDDFSLRPNKVTWVPENQKLDDFMINLVGVISGPGITPLGTTHLADPILKMSTNVVVPAITEGVTILVNSIRSTKVRIKNGRADPEMTYWQFLGVVN